MKNLLGESRSTWFNFFLVKAAYFIVFYYATCKSGNPELENSKVQVDLNILRC